MITQTPEPPYYAVVFTSIRTDGDNGYTEMDEYLEELVQHIPGYIGIESARQDMGISVSYWSSLEAIKEWKEAMVHVAAQKYGKEKWYSTYKVRVCKVERDYGF